MLHHPLTSLNIMIQNIKVFSAQEKTNQQTNNNLKNNLEKLKLHAGQKNWLYISHVSPASL